MSDHRWYRCIRASLNLGCNEKEWLGEWPPAFHRKCAACGSDVVWDDDDSSDRLVAAFLAENREDTQGG